MIDDRCIVRDFGTDSEVGIPDRVEKPDSLSFARCRTSRMLDRFHRLSLAWVMIALPAAGSFFCSGLEIVSHPGQCVQILLEVGINRHPRVD
jgi:hypothetical protein